MRAARTSAPVVSFAVINLSISRLFTRRTAKLVTASSFTVLFLYCILIAVNAASEGLSVAVSLVLISLAVMIVIAAVGKISESIIMHIKGKQQ